MLLVNFCSTSARLSKPMTSPRSVGRSLRTNPMAASCAVAMRSSMLELVSMSSDSATGRLLRLKRVSSCLTPSSKISKSFSVEIGDVPAGGVGDRDVHRHDVDGRPERRLLRAIMTGAARAVASEQQRKRSDHGNTASTAGKRPV